MTLDPGLATAAREAARALAAGVVEEGAGWSSVEIERAALRLLGVEGVDGYGRPLAAEVVERFARSLGAARLGRGVGLAVAAAAVEYDLAGRDVAQEIAHGYLDLSLEAELLDRPDARAAAERWLGERTAAVVERIAAERTARRELQALLGPPPATLVVLDTGMTDATDAGRAAGHWVTVGVDGLRVHTEGMTRRDPRDAVPGRASGARPPDRTPGPPPAPSAHRLAPLRRALDEVAVAEGRYLALGSSAPGVDVAEQAVAAALERLDVVFADPLAAVVGEGVAARRALVAHLWAFRILDAAGVMVAVGPGGTTVARELLRGVPVDRGTRSGHRLALQLLSVEIARAGGIASEALVVGAVPNDVGADDGTLRDGIAEVAARRALFPDLRTWLEEPEGIAASRWFPAVVAWFAGGPSPALVVRPPGRAEAASVRAAVEVAGWVGTTAASVGDDGPERLLRVALRAIEEIDRLGLDALTGDLAGGAEPDAAGVVATAGAVASDGYDGPLVPSAAGWRFRTLPPVLG